MGGLAEQDSYDPFASEKFVNPLLGSLANVPQRLYEAMPTPQAGATYPDDQTAMLPETYANPIATAAVKTPEYMMGGIAKLIDTASQTPYGLRREDVTDIPGSAQPVDPLASQSLDTTANLAGLGMGFAEPGAAGIFGGRLAKTADLDALARAEKMAAEGTAPNAIHAATGWFQGADSQWKFEIPDEASKWSVDPRSLQAPSFLGAPRLGDAVPMGSAFDHPELYAAYPQLANTNLEVFGRRGAVKGSYQTGGADGSPTVTLQPTSPDAMRSTNLHELQHGVQDIEGFATGGNTYGLKPNTPAWDIYQERLAAMKTPLDRETYSKVAGFDGPVSDKDYNAYLKIVRRGVPGADRAAQEYAVQSAYQRMAGEVEARNVQARADFTPDQRAAQPPLSTQQFPNDMQFVKFRNPDAMGSLAEPQMAVDPRMWSPISKQKLRKPFDEYEHGFTDVRTPVPKIVDPASLVGGYGIFTPSDLSATNRTVTHIDGVPLASPVTAHGGVGFPEANPGMAWASEQPIMRRLDNQAAALSETGKPVYIMPMTMSPQAIDASHHVADPLAQLVQRAPIASDDAAAFNEMMRKRVPGWVDIDSPSFQDYISNLQGGMTTKSLMANRMALSQWQEKGFPDVAGVRHAMSDLSLINLPRNTTGMAISRYTPGQGLLENTHPSYGKSTAGEYMGQLASLLPFDVAASDIAKPLAVKNAENLAQGAKNMISPAYHMGKPTEGVPREQYFDQQWLDNVMKHLER